MSSTGDIAPSALVLDADNTLWDTNRVFETARQQMLAILVAATEEASAKDATPEVIRDLARSLSLPESERELDVIARATAFFLCADGPDDEAKRVEWAARRAQTGAVPDTGANESKIREAADAFRATLRTVPPLLPGADDLLNAVRTWRADRPAHRRSVLFSEGQPDRLDVAFEAYDIGTGRHFDDIVLREKTPDAFSTLRTSIEAALEHADPGSLGADIVVVGDSLRRDIQPANVAGCTTIYCPGDYKGHQTPSTPDEEPDYVVSTLEKVRSILAL